MKGLRFKLSLGWGVLMLVALTTGCNAHPKSPVPANVVERIRSFVITDGHEPKEVDVFSMPGGIILRPTPVDAVTVQKIQYDGSLPMPAHTGGIPTGTMLYRYIVWGTRVQVNGTVVHFTRLFHAYVNESGTWDFYAGPERNVNDF